jgi:hypothetical protein
MANRISRSYQERSIEQINWTYKILIGSVDLSFSNKRFLQNTIFYLKSSSELDEIKRSEMNEIERYTSFDIISSIEAMFKIDYCYRCEKRLKDDLSRDFRRIYKRYENRVDFKEHILAIWAKYNPQNTLMNDLFAIQKYRNWLAHGRYWLLKANTSKYDFKYLNLIARQVALNLNLYRV